MDLQQMIADVEVSGDDPLQRVEAAAAMRQQIEQLSDEVLDHFVKRGTRQTAARGRRSARRSASRARPRSNVTVGWRAGCGRDSPTACSSASRRGPRAAVTASQDEARARQHAAVETEHILLGLFASAGGNVATVVLGGMGIDREAVVRLVDERVPDGDGPPRGHVPFSKRAKKTLELTLRESLRLGHNYIGCEHILLALSRVEDGTASRILTDLGATHDRLEQAIKRAPPQHRLTTNRPDHPPDSS